MRKTPECQNTLQSYQQQGLEKKNPLNFLRKDFKSIKKRWGFLKKMKILINLHKLQNIQPYPASKTYN